MSELVPNRWTTRNKPVLRHVIAKVEQSWQIHFPAEYIALATEFYGGHPDNDAITLPGGETRDPLELATYEEESQSHIARYWVTHFDGLPVRVFRFAEDGAGNTFVFNDGESAKAPSIWWYDHEFRGDDGLFEGVQIASSFADFLTRLHRDTL